MATPPAPSEQALLALWDLIDQTRLKQSEAHAAILARKAYEAAARTKETGTMNERLKAIAKKRGVSERAVERMLHLTKDAAFVESVLNDADFMEKMGDAMGVSYQDKDSTTEIIRLKDDSGITPKPKHYDARRDALAIALGADQTKGTTR